MLATKFKDGHSQDQWAVGFYNGVMEDYGSRDVRYDVVDNDSKSLRRNGFRRIKKISRQRGDWILKHKEDIERSGKSMFYFARCKMID